MDSAVLYYWNAESVGSSYVVSRTAYVTTVQATSAALAWSTDSTGTSDSSFETSDSVYVRGNGFPSSRDVTVYIIPDGVAASLANAVSYFSATTTATGDLPNTLAWGPPLTSGQYDIWVDVNQNGAFDTGDVWNNQAGGIYAFSVTGPPPAGEIWSSDSAGNRKDVFMPDETVYVTVPATGQTVWLYVVADQTTWNDGDALIDMSGGAELVTLSSGPGTQTIPIWLPPLVVGSYDIVMHVGVDSVFDSRYDLVDSVQITGFNVVPEVPLGIAMTFLSMITALVGFIGFKHLRPRFRLQ
jgi:hypothetical protein